MRLILVGPPLVGKTTLLKEFEKLGLNTFNADQYIHQIYEKGQPGFEIIKEEWGDRFINQDRVDRIKLALEITKNQDILLRLNEIIHPIVQHKYNESEYQIAEIPLVVFSKSKINYDKIIFLKPANRNVLLKRLELESRNLNNKFIELAINKWEDEKIQIEDTFIIDDKSNYEKLAFEIKNKFF